MKKIAVLLVLLVSLLVASLASAEEEFSIVTPPIKISSRLDRVAEKMGKLGQRMTIKLIEKLNLRYSKRTGFQLFEWKSGIVSIKSGKAVYLLPNKPNREISLDYHGGSRNEVVMGYSVKF